MSGILGTRVMAALTTLFNVLALNLVLLLASLPLVTAPAAVYAASVALDRWRRDGEDRVVREFIIVLRSGSFGRVSLVTGVPLAAVALGVLEVHHFAVLPGLAARLWLGLGCGALLVTLTALGYVFELTATVPASGASPRPAWTPAEVWSLAARLAIRNLLFTGPLAVVPIAAATALTLVDPGLLLLGLPLLLLQLLKLTARLGLRRAAQALALLSL